MHHQSIACSHCCVVYFLKVLKLRSIPLLHVHINNMHWHQAFSQRGVRVSFGHTIADFGHPNIHFFFYAVGWKGIGHPIHPKCAFFDVHVHIPNSEILAKAMSDIFQWLEFYLIFLNAYDEINDVSSNYFTCKTCIILYTIMEWMHILLSNSEQ